MTNTKKTTADDVKEMLSDPKHAIVLDDFVSQHIRKFLQATDLEHFPVQGSNIQEEDIVDRIKTYEDVVRDMQVIVILLARWGDSEKQLLLEKIFDRLIEAETGNAGLTVWLRMRWYPILLLLYSAGISALSAKKYQFFSELMRHEVSGNLTDQKKLPLVVAAFVFSGEITQHFKLLPNLNDKYAPRSERVFEILQPIFDELLFLGGSYEKHFDEFEVYTSLMSMDLTPHGWGPVGRFGWKYDRSDESPFHTITEQAKQAGKGWVFLQHNCFNGSPDRFLEVSEALRERLNHLGWW